GLGVEFRLEVEHRFPEFLGGDARQIRTGLQEPMDTGDLDEPVEVYHVRRIKESIAIIIVNPFMA
ncbi:MAG: hypothetical protein MUO53_02465, partial [Maribacter sp.]|nr:hypothetical protein [Maribacter sp.]